MPKRKKSSLGYRKKKYRSKPLSVPICADVEESIPICENELGTPYLIKDHAYSKQFAVHKDHLYSDIGIERLIDNVPSNECELEASHSVDHFYCDSVTTNSSNKYGTEINNSEHVIDDSDKSYCNPVTTSFCYKCAIGDSGIETITESGIDVIDDLDTVFIFEEDPEDGESFEAKFDLLTEHEILANSLTAEIKSPFVVRSNSSAIEIISFYDHEELTTVKLKLKIDSDFKARIFVHNKEVHLDHAIWQNSPSYFSETRQVLKLWKKIETYTVCIGNPDKEFTDLVPYFGKDLSDNTELTALAYQEGNFFASQGNLPYQSTIRTTQCALLVEGTRCSRCSKYRRCLRQRKERLKKLVLKEKDLVHSNFKHCDMPREILIRKINQQKEQINSLQHEVDKMKRDLRKDVKKNGVYVAVHEEKELHSGLTFSCYVDDS